jgi:chromate transport protein ChrA
MTPYALKDLLIYFLKLGSWGFGGPAALVGYMHRDLVEKKMDYREGFIGRSCVSAIDAWSWQHNLPFI